MERGQCASARPHSAPQENRRYSGPMTVRTRTAGLLLLGVMGLPLAVLTGGHGRLAAGMGSPCPPDPPTPVVALRVRVPAVAGLGQELEYHICVENSSAAAAHHVLVRNPLPANTRFVRATPEPSTRTLNCSGSWGHCPQGLAG